MNMDLLKQEKNRGYVIAGGAGIIAFIAFFLPYVSFFVISASGATIGSWLWLQFLAVLVVIAVAAVFVFRNNLFTGVVKLPMDKQVLYGRYTLVGAAGLALLIHIVFALYIHGFGLSFGWWLFLLAAIAMVVGGVLALRSPVQVTAQTSYPPYQQPYNP